jgi:hypothetical protein
MIALQQLPAVAGLAANEMVLGVAPSARHDTLLSSYLFNVERGPGAVRDMIVADLRRFLALGAQREAADRLIVLRRFLSGHPQAGKVPPQRKREGVVSIPFSSSRCREREDRIRRGEAGGRALIYSAREKLSPVVWSGLCPNR